MGAMIASGAPVPLSAIEGVTAQQTDALAEHGVTDIDGLANTTVDDLVEYLDVSLDEAETMLNAARAVIEIREKSLQGDESVEQAELESEISEQAPGLDATVLEGQHAVSAELDENADVGGVEPNNAMTAPGYDQAVEQGTPYSAEANHRAQESAEPVALTEADQFTVDELVLQEAGRDLRPDVVTPAPDITSSAVADLEAESDEETEALENAEAGPVQAEAKTESALEISESEVAANESGEKQDLKSEISDFKSEPDASNDAAK